MPDSTMERALTVAPARRMAATARLRQRVLSIDASEVSFAVRGFHQGSEAAREGLERHGRSFVTGYNAALRAPEPEALSVAVEEVPHADRGFAYEGAAMALALMDLLGRHDRLGALLASPQGEANAYMLHVGAGWALARMRLRPRAHLRSLNPFLVWLAVDGYGFHHGFFAPRDRVEHQTPKRLRGYERRVFDQGLGRSLWFVSGGDPARASGLLARFPEHRRDDLWSGLGLAATYTTTATNDQLVYLVAQAGGHRPALAQGAAFAAAARHRAGNVTEHTRRAAAIVCAQPIQHLVELVEEARRGLVAEPDGRGYELWRRRIASSLEQSWGTGV